MYNAQNKTREWQIWGFYFDLLRTFVKREKHSNVPITHEEKGVQLGKWVARQRAYGPTLTEHQKDLLESIAGWHWNDTSQLSDIGLGENLPLFPPVGKARPQQPPASRRRRIVVSIDDSNCIVQRDEGSQSESIVIREDKGTTTGAGGWESRFRLLLKFMNREGHPRVPVNHVENGVKLGVWVANQKQIYRSRKMKPDRQEKLERLPGWVWNRQAQKDYPRSTADKVRTNEERWDEHLALLKQFGEREGHYLVPSRHVEDGFRLGVWVARHRSKRWSIDKAHREKLDKVDGWTWDGQEGKWIRRYNLLLQFVAREGHAHVVKGHVEDDVKLGIWVMHQHDSYRRGELPDSRTARLEAIPEWKWSGEPEDLTGLEVDNVAQDVWNALFGLGIQTEENACLTAVRHLYEEGIVKARSAKEGSPIYRLLIDSLKRGIELGIFDQPEDRHFRAVLTDVRCYETADWMMCIQRTMEGGDSPQEQIIENAFSWASQFLGLEWGRPGERELAFSCLRDVLGQLNKQLN